MGRFEKKDGVFEYSEPRLAQGDFKTALDRVKKLVLQTNRSKSVAELLDRPTNRPGVPRTQQR